MFPSWRYHSTEPARIVDSPEEEAALGNGWADTPAAFGIETAPGVKPDPKIARNRPKPAKAAAAPTPEKA